MLKNKLRDVLLIVLFLSLFGVVLAVCSPGLYSYDTFSGLNEVFEGRHHHWLSTLYSHYLKLLVEMIPHPSIFAVVQILFSSLVCASIFSYFISQGLASVSWLIGGVVFLSPLFLLQNIVVTRDFWQAWIQLLLVFEAYKALMAGAEGQGAAPSLKVSNFSQSLKKNVLVSPCRMAVWQSLSPSLRILFLTVLLLLLRRDNLLLAPLFIGLALWVSPRPGRHLVYFLVGLCLAVGGLSLGSKVSPGQILLGSNRYRLTAFVNPLSYILAKRSLSDFDSGDLDKISAVVPVERLVSKQNDYGVNPISRYKSNFSQDEFEQFKKVYFKLVLENKALFLQNRWRLFQATMAVNSRGSQLPHRFYEMEGPKAETVRREFRARGASVGKKNKGFFGFSQKLVHWVRSSKAGGYLLLNSALLSLFVIVSGFSLFLWAPVSALLSGIYLVRLSMVFFLAPAAQFNYVYPSYLFGFFLIGFVFLELKLRSVPAQEALRSHKVKK